jgi:prepilin peptidase CpaA
MLVPQYLAVIVALVACVTDVRDRKIPNLLTVSAAGLGGLYHFGTASWSGFGWSARGWAVGLAMFLPIFLLRGIGGGDVKLLAALGAWLGPGQIVWVALFAAVAGGPMAIALALSRGYLRQAVTNVWGLLMFWRVAGLQPHPALTLENSAAPRLPYALPIFVGLVVTLWLR